MSNKSHRALITEINWFMLFREIIAVYSEIHMKLMNRYSLLAKCRVLLTLKKVAHIVTTVH
jgi:hypothetical protein